MMMDAGCRCVVVDGGEAAAVWVEWGGDGAREGEWVRGSNRSEDGECFWSWPEKSAGKLFRRRRGGGRRWGASPEKVPGKTEKLSGMSFHIELL
ncbi:hypothetical protein Tco_1062935 [Tanacetum coccineum]